MNNIAVLFCETIPDNLQDGVLYASMKYETAIHLCACGCKGQVVTPLHGDGWSFSMDAEGPTLHPSIGNQRWPCKSHYYVRNGKIEWLQS